MDFFTYYIGIIPRGSYIRLVLGLAIFGDLATFFIFQKNGHVYSEQKINCDVIMVLFLNTVLGIGE